MTTRCYPRPTGIDRDYDLPGGGRDSGYDEPITNPTDPHYDWVDDPTLTSTELMARFNLLPTVQVVGPATH